MLWLRLRLPSATRGMTELGPLLTKKGYVVVN